MADSKIKYEVIQQYVNKEITRGEAAVLLDLSNKQITRLKQKFDQCNPDCFVHKSLGSFKNSKLKKVDWFVIAELYRKMEKDSEGYTSSGKEIEGLNYNHFFDKIIGTIVEMYGVECSVNTLAIKLQEQNVYSPKARKIKTMDEIKDKHFEGDKRKYTYGEVVEIDGVERLKFPDDKEESTLVSAVDAYNSMYVGAFFDATETLHAYVKCTEMILNSVGSPELVVGDNRAGLSKGIDDLVRDTRYCNALRLAGSEITTTSHPKGKPHIENKNNVARDRLLHEFAILGIRTREEANKRMAEVIEIVNNDLKLYPSNESRYKQVPKNLDFMKETALEIPVTTYRNTAIRYDNDYYLIVKDNVHIRFPYKTKLTLRKYVDGTLKVEANCREYDVVIANIKQLNELEDEYLREHPTIVTTCGCNFYFAPHKKHYHLVDNFGKPLKFETRDKIKVIHDKEFNIIRVIHNKRPRNIIEGKCIPKKDVVFERTSKMRYNGQIDYDCKTYILLTNKLKHFMPGESEDIVLTIENDKVIDAKYNGVSYLIIEFELVKHQYKIPSSKYTAKIHFEQYNDINKISI